MDSGIIHNFKTFYHHEIVNIFLECLENKENPNKIFQRSSNTLRNPVLPLILKRRK